MFDNVEMKGSKYLGCRIVFLDEEFEIIETVRTGAISLERGTQNIYDQTKEKGEFDYGKNVL